MAIILANENAEEKVAMRDAYVDALIALAEHDPRILASDYRLIVEHARARERAFSPAKLFAR